jgi:hypothetical protein
MADRPALHRTGSEAIEEASWGCHFKISPRKQAKNIDSIIDIQASRHFTDAPLGMGIPPGNKEVCFEMEFGRTG